MPEVSATLEVVVEVSGTGTVVELEVSAIDPVVAGADVADGATVPIRTMATRSSVATGSGGLQADEAVNRNTTISTGTWATPLRATQATGAGLSATWPEGAGVRSGGEKVGRGDGST
ncbi:MAG TPA: hypothetical protein EYP97_10305, partial [Acidimicrobiia bacterium]|nr:hypothetical protein [Acidimicrobiia bacterium]